MLFLLLSIFTSTTIAIVFKLQDKYNIKLFPVIVLNYFTATISGVLLNKSDISFDSIVNSSWIWSAVFMGIALIIGFFLIGYSTQKIGIAITTVSNKMSVVLPMTISIFLFNEHVTKIKIIGIIVALISVFFTVYRKRTKEIEIKFIFLPIFLFLAIGTIDTLLKIAQVNLSEAEIPVFTAISFGISGLAGVVISFFNDTKFKDFITPKVLLTGVIIGLANFGSMFFMINALNHSGLDSSVVFGINNICVISLSVLLAFFFFKEKLSAINWSGVALSVFAIILLTEFYKIFL